MMCREFRQYGRMKFALILMVRNEERILKRCLEAVESFVDVFCICDTGSTDKTCEIAEEFLKTRNGCLTKTTWKDFGHNRSFSFTAAQNYLKATMGKDELKNIYGLLIDADMVFVPGTLKEQKLTELGYTIIQCGGSTEYPNTRLIRMDYAWKCVGVTHEYWDGPVKHLPKSTCYIDDRNDGGCKTDKFERDARLLEKGLEDQPTNVRYMFYLAQTYHGLGRLPDAIKMYKRRIAAGGWIEEIWYSHYMIGQSYLTLGKPIKFEQWMLRACEIRPGRAEALYKLTKYFREVGDQFKAYEYARKGINIPFSVDSLFIEKPIYTGLFDYEMSILDYYLKYDGRKSSIACMLKCEYNVDNILSNLKFYVNPPKETVIRPFVVDRIFGQKYTPTAVSVLGDTTNVRFVNYWIDNGDYKTPDGEVVVTKNAVNGVTPIADIPEFPKRADANILGLEDIRLYRDELGRTCFTATTVEHEGPRVQTMRGVYNSADCVLMKSPENRDCEKNWLPINDTNRMIYDWRPLRIGQVDGDNLKIDIVHETPPIFSLFRGSAPPIKVGDALWALVHFVKYDTPRKYYHCFVSLDSETYKPTAITLPFVFRSVGIEYCVSCRVVDDSIECNVSFNDKDSSVATFPKSSLDWVSF